MEDLLFQTTEAAPDQGAVLPSPDELAARTVSELKTIARRLGNRGTTVDFLTKQQLIALILKGHQTSMESTTHDAPASMLANAITALVQSQGLVTTAMLDKQIDAALASKTMNTSLPEDVRNTIVTLAETAKMLDRRVKELNENRVLELSLKQFDGTAKNVGKVHKTFPDLLKVASLNLAENIPAPLNVWLVGPAGTGKTTAAGKLAEALALPFYFNGAIDSEYKLRGFIDAQGKVIYTPFRKAYIEGGVYLFDEVDSSLPAALLAFNAALANHHYDFPDRVHERHPRFICLAAANTYGLGADFQYVGRMKQDAAFLDRWVQIEWPIDEALELEIADDKEWVEYVQSMRKKAVAKGLQVVISPRASIFGSILLAGGVTREKVIQYTLRKAMTATQWNDING